MFHFWMQYLQYRPIISVCVLFRAALMAFEHLSDIFLPRPSSICLWSSCNPKPHRFQVQQTQVPILFANTGLNTGQESCVLFTLIWESTINSKWTKVKAKGMHVRIQYSITDEGNSVLELLHSRSCRLSEPLARDESPCENRLPARAVSLSPLPLHSTP